ncbi:tetratricopeptide repeat protein [Pseudomonas sp. TTU2014-080ASC]|uniref:tetratricopeptide repeat protein n=1 Tax=Pseudomonas sp. TTU2014-080ASC TaxID=1729724 RepID=UPI0007183CD7|nr:tetratricopeptide repeat protein [Pseudomonas sp. TTU2014-080ASC]KRW62777.1 hypothetical protein AO726_04980 [Pseudomonas sp. TTU2014-080ASC]
MKRTGCTLSLGCLLLLLPLLANAGGNSLLIPATSSCALNAGPEDFPAALEACEKAANSGDLQAVYELGELYYSGEHTERDLDKALHWFEQASLQGHAQAQYRLGMMFFHGEGVPANAMQAYIVLKMAAVNGSDEAMDDADVIAAQMPNSELEVATQVLGQIFRNYLLELQNTDLLRSPFAPLP